MTIIEKSNNLEMLFVAYINARDKRYAVDECANIETEEGRNAVLASIEAEVKARKVVLTAAKKFAAELGFNVIKFDNYRTDKIKGLVYALVTRAKEIDTFLRGSVQFCDYLENA